jgi:hypothetical protein
VADLRRLIRPLRPLWLAAILVLLIAVTLPAIMKLRHNASARSGSTHTAGGATAAAPQGGEGEHGATGPGGSVAQGRATAGPDRTRTVRRPRHYISNVDAQWREVAAVGYNLVDAGPNVAEINALPDGIQALVWLGNLGKADCPPPDVSWPAFTAAVDRLAGNSKVYGYFIADEPHPKTCSSAVGEIRRRADYIRARDASQRSFIVVVDGTNQCGGTYGCEYAALRPAETHVDLIGLDPYPCNVHNTASGCAHRKIDNTVRRAVANGIPASAIVPVFQVFGQTCAASSSNYYRMPTAAELRQMLARWTALVPSPAFDYTYTWGHQRSSCPTLVDANGDNGYPDLQSVLREYNTRG